MGDVVPAQASLDWIMSLGSPKPPEYFGVSDTPTFTAKFDALVRFFQTRTRLEVDGVIGPKTWRRIFAFAGIDPAIMKPKQPAGEGEAALGAPTGEALPGVPGPRDIAPQTIRKGDKNSDVQRAQFYIDYIFFGGGYQPPAYSGFQDDPGEFTVRFEAQVRLFQARTDLDVDGVIGPNTWRMIDFYDALQTINRRLSPRIFE